MQIFVSIYYKINHHVANLKMHTYVPTNRIKHTNSLLVSLPLNVFPFNDVVLVREKIYQVH